jgi:hypothetical protein
MSTNALEKALWRVASDEKDIRRFREDPHAYLMDFKLDDEERSLLLEWNVNEIVSRGVNPLLVLSAFGSVKGMAQLPEYIMKINQPRGVSGRGAPRVPGGTSSTTV